MKNILVCHTGAWIGDTVLVTPTLRELKQLYPDSSITFFLRKNIVDLMDANPYIDKCIVDTKKDGTLKSFWGLYRIIKNDAYDIAIVLHPTSFRNAVFPYLARIPIRIGSNYKGRGFFLTASIPHNTKQHEITRYLNALKLLNSDSFEKINSIRKKNDRLQKLEFWHTNKEREAVENILRSYGITIKDKLVAINIGTTWKTKQWDVKNFIQIINHIVSIRDDIRCILIGSNVEKQLLKNIEIPDSTIDLIGKTNILQLGALLERSEICLTCDSGPMHIAAAVGTPTVALFGPTDPTRHKPFGKGHIVIETPLNCRPCYKRGCQRRDNQHLCMKEINVTEVLTALTTQLS